ncbi:hypothetical protein OIE71_20425 [Streptomyces sp. NBC_01725]|uniref:DUF6612 family protein n=1 Tax=unclassified Streptomyces TaxID=2593676 RepID=UPI0011CCB711|nr:MULTISPECIES: DUF6612 family protein [unclassified Streptomyces]TXL90369.1 hypothetical protein EW053_11055 [Streptomyces sp. IB2014 016-6]
MTMSAWGRVGVSLTALAVVAGVAGCQSDDPDTKKTGSSAANGGEPQSRSAVTEVLTAAYEKTAAAKSAKVSMTMSMPAGAAGAAGGGEMEMSGVMGWDPMVMDMTMTGSMMQAEPDAPDKIRMVWVKNAMYMDMGAEAAKDMDGKRWMKLDLAAAAEASGDPAVAQELTGGMENMNQDPAQQLALLLDSPNVKHVGSEKVDGVDAQHYKGTLTVAEMVESNESLDVLSAKERKDLLAGIEKSGIEGYDIEVWVNEDDYPVKMDVAMDSPQGDIKMSARYSDYGAKASVQAPPAGDTVDLFEMLGDLGGAAGAGADDSGI